MMFKCGKLMLSVSCRDQSNQFQPSQGRRNPRGKGAFATCPRFCKINPISIRGQIMPITLLLGPPDFQTFSRICGPPQTGKSFRSLAHNTFDFFLKNFQMENSFSTHWLYICKRMVLKSIIVNVYYYQDFVTLRKILCKANMDLMKKRKIEV